LLHLNPVKSELGLAMNLHPISTIQNVEEKLRELEQSKSTRHIDSIAQYFSN